MNRIVMAANVTVSRRITQLASKLFHAKADYRPRILLVEKRLRGVLDGNVIFDTTGACLVWEHQWFPQYWIPKSSFTKSTTFTEDKPISGINSSTSKLASNNKTISALVVPDSFNTPLANMVKVNFTDLDQWFEEQVQIHYHPKDPFHRVDILPSGRHVKVAVDSTVLADTGSEGGVMSLWETRFPPRWYLPRTSIKWEYLKPSETKTGCPYKGEASYYNVVIDGNEYKDVVWWYKSPTKESAEIVGMLCFYPDKVDTWVDGKQAEKIGMPVQKKTEERENGHTEHGKSCGC